MNITIHDPALNTRIFDRVPSALTAMRIMDKVKDRLLGVDNVWAIGVKNSGMPYIVTLKFIKDCINDNREMVFGMLGNDLTAEIENF